MTIFTDGVWLAHRADTLDKKDGGVNMIGQVLAPPSCESAPCCPWLLYCTVTHQTPVTMVDQPTEPDRIGTYGDPFAASDDAYNAAAKEAGGKSAADMRSSGSSGSASTSSSGGGASTSASASSSASASGT